MERRSGSGARATRAASASGRLGREQHHRVALGIVAAPPGPPGQLCVLARGERGPAGTAELGEALDDDGARRHVDAERQRLGREDHLQQPRREALLDRLSVGGDEARVVGGQAGLQTLEPFGVPEHAEVVVGERLDVALGDGADGVALGPGGEPDPVTQALADRVVAGGAAEDEDDGWAAARRPRTARPPPGAGASAPAGASGTARHPGPRPTGVGSVRRAAPTGRSGAPRRRRPRGASSGASVEASSARRWTAKWWRSVIGPALLDHDLDRAADRAQPRSPARWRWTPSPTGRRR